VNHDSWVLLARALESILAHPPSDRSWEVIVVDDASEQRDRRGTRRVRRLLADAGGTFLVRNECAGYAAGMNMARKASTGRLLLVCHPDVRFRPGCIDRLTAHHDANPSVGAVVPEVFVDAGLECRLAVAGTPTLTDHVSGALSTVAPSLGGRRRRRWLGEQLRVWQANGPVEVPAVTGECFLVSRELTEGIGLFDERFFLHYESADFSHRLRRARRRIMQVSGARVVHLVGGSSSADPERASALRARSRRHYYDKWYGFGGRWVHDASLALLQTRWARTRIRKHAVPPARPIVFERGRPVLHLPRTADAFLVQIGFDPWFRQVAGVLGRGSRWSPGDALLKRLPGTVWFRVLDLTFEPYTELGVWIHEPDPSQMFAAPHELEQG
jgi:N-acetylglucosaminyl-diphospho-decaprenol L-rhamnosyltransferase